MRLSPPSLLGMAALATVAACRLNSTGLGAADAGRTSTAGAGGGSAGGGSAGALSLPGDDASSAVGSSGVAGVGDAGSGGVVAGAGSGGDDGVAGVTGTTGGAGDGDGAGSSGSGEEGGQGGSAAGAGGAAGTMSMPDAATVSPMGCADGTREGLQPLLAYPNVAACAGGWQIAGFVAPETLTPQCDRRAGNDGDLPDGEGCSVADLCAEGWHVCESAQEFSTKAKDCGDAFPGGAVPEFYATRQRGPDKTCDPMNLTGTNNVYGCGNFGSAAMAICAPFMHMLRDADCKANPPWMCVNGPINYSITELLDVTKPGSARGGVLCCR
jgi:hypothetical protein